jgi:hypothetical protein
MPPIPPPSVSAPYDMLESVLNLARTRLNDAIASIGGDILKDTQPFTAVMTNQAWRKLQAFLCNLGYSRYKRKFWAYGLPPVGSNDPSSETVWTWTSFYDGAGFWYPPSVPVLPSDFIAPLVVKERQSGSNQIFSYMRSAPDGLPEGQKRPWNGIFEWKNDAIYMPGSTFMMDMEVEYAAFDADFVVTNGVLGDPATVPATVPSNMPVPIMRCQSSFANFLAAECAMGRDDVDVSGLIDMAEKDAKLLMNNSDVKLKERRPIQRRAYSGRRGGSCQLWGTQGY